MSADQKFQATVGGVYEAYLSILGYGVTTETKARRHLNSIGRALADQPPAEIRANLLAKKSAIQDRWGSLTTHGQFLNDLEILPTENWLRTRTSKERTFGTLQLAARILLNGETNLSMVHVGSFGLGGPQRLVTPVGLDTFKLWLKRTGICHVTAESRVYAPGSEANRIAQMTWPEMKALLISGNAAG